MKKFQIGSKKPRHGIARTYYCPHCKKKVSKSTWYSRHSRYFNSCNGTWEAETVGSSNITGNDFVFESDDSSTSENQLQETSAAQQKWIAYYNQCSHFNHLRNVYHNLLDISITNEIHLTIQQLQ